MLNFTYNEISTSDLNLLIADFDTVDSLNSGLTREIIKGDSNKYRLVPNHFGTKYTNVIEFQKALIKNDGSSFSAAEIRNINKWLTGYDIPKKLEFSDGINTYIYYGIFTDIQYKLAGNGIIGIVVTFTNNSPFLYREDSHSYTISNSENIDFICNSDLLNDYTYPVITLNYTGSKTDSTVTLTQISDNNKKMSVKVLRQIPITIDSYRQIVKNPIGSVSYNSIGWNDDIYWLRLKSGTNTIQVNASEYPCTLDIHCLSQIKLGDAYEY